MTVLGKLITIPWMVLSFILLEGDHHGDGVQPYPWDSGDPPDDGWQPSLGWWVTKFWILGEPPLDGG